MSTRWVAALSLLALVVGAMAGMRLQLAKQRLREVRRTLDRMRNAESLENAFLMLLNKRKLFESAGRAEHVRILNAAQFVIIWNWDLTTLLHQIGADSEVWSLDTGWRKKLLARTLALSSYESLIKLQRMVDVSENRVWSVRRGLRSLGIDKLHAKELDACHADIATLLGVHEPLLTGIRNNIMGHRDNDVSRQLEWMRQADAKEIETLGYELLRLTTRLIVVLTNITGSLVTLEAKSAARPVAT